MKSLVDVEVRIELLHEWMGNPKGSTMVVWKHVADTLIERGTAQLASSLEGKEESVSDTHKIAGRDKGEESVDSQAAPTKAFKRPPKDKMLKNSETK